jgi:hypothetical protein
MLSGMILLTVMLPTSYLLTKSYGITGTAFANLVSIIIYNGIRIIFLWRKFRLFPFTVHSLYTLLWAAACFAICYFAFASLSGWAAMIVRSFSFLVLYGTGSVYLKLSPDLQPVVGAIRKRTGL